MASPFGCDNNQKPIAPGVSATFRLQAGHDGSISANAWQDTEKADRMRVANRPARQRRLAGIYDRADRRAIGSTDPHILAATTLAHWMYVRSTGAGIYPLSKMASDYRFGFLARAGLTARDIKALPHNSRPQIVRRIVLAAYRAHRAEQQLVAGLQVV